jgi:transglutaminase-like putative cysteine protease
MLIALGWLRLEDPGMKGADWLWLVLLALAPALAPRLWQRLALIPPAALIAAWIALDTPALDDRPGFFSPVFDRFYDGVGGFYDVSVPFAAAEHQRMHGVLLLAIFGFCVLLAQAIAARRALPALLVVIAGAGWPAALYPSDSVAYGALILAASLWVLAGLGTTRPVPAAVAGAVLILAAAGASSSAAVAKDGVLAWEEWSPGAGRQPVSVSYVWEGTYGGIEFAKKKTTLLRIKGPKKGLYWRATTLDQFDSDRWLENPTPLSTGIARGRLPNDPLLPAKSLNRRTWVRQDVEVVALRDTHIVAAAQPVSLDAPSLGGVFRLSDGIVRVYNGLRRGQSYTAYSYAPRPGAAELAPLDAEYPPALDRFLDIGRTRVDPFGTPGRDRLVDSLFADDRYLALWPYEDMWREARRLRADARTPYGAVIAIETWLRTTGGFTYDESPPGTGGAPPLAHFVAEGKRGYCQHFAGAMALMLRLLGIPARVAAGFTSGTYEDGGWTVTDHNAHAWVEVWFPGYGWLAFDPTPGRGSLAAAYSASSTGFNAGDAADGFVSGTAGGVRGGGADQLRLLEQRERIAEQQAARQAARQAQDGSHSALWLLLLLVVVAAAAIGAIKLVRRRLRYLTRDPRRLASAARHELVDFLADQGIAVAPSATPDDLHELVRTEFGMDARSFAQALAAARFGPAGKSAAAATAARRELRSLLRLLRHRLGRSARLRGLVALKSLRT